MVNILTDRLHRLAYATDASVYRELPLGVAYPKTEEELAGLFAEAARRDTHLIPRAAGTSIAGQVVGDGIVADIRSWNKVLEINPEQRWARVQPGVVRDELNLALKPHGLFFSPETSTSNRCCIGGMFGNNSCGTHALRYGATRDHVLSCKGILADGSLFDTRRMGEEDYRKERPLLDAVLRQLEQWAADGEVRRLVADRFPDPGLRRRSCGYALDEALDVVETDKGLALCRLLAGSEGTLAFITELTVSLDPLPPQGKMAVCVHCPSLEDAFEGNLVALAHGPFAVELMDGKILELSFRNPALRCDAAFAEGDPAALLIIEFRADGSGDMDAAADAFEKDILSSGHALRCKRVYGEELDRVWDLRKAGLGVLSTMKGDAKPVGVIEDTAVAPARLPAYLREISAMLAELDAPCVYYGHISTGELHLRPILNLKQPGDRFKFRTLALRTAELVRRHRGTLSGEHGDGRLRGEWIPLVYGRRVYEMMCRLKRLWDPQSRLNRGKIVFAPAMDSCLRYDAAQDYVVAHRRREPVYNWKASFDECPVEGTSPVRSQWHAMVCSVEQCNGAGACLKGVRMGGTMCPAFRASGDELDVTRARANLLRELLTRGGDTAEVKPLLDSCLACKACLTECPSAVDLSKLRSEVLQLHYDRHGTPLRTWIVARLSVIESLGSLIRPLYNAVVRWKPTAALLKTVMGFAAARSLPALSRRSMRALVSRENRLAPPGKGRKVWLFADEFTNREEAELGLRFARLLRALGYAVEVPRHGESGRAAFSKGCLRRARRLAKRNVELLSPLVSEETPLVGIEPSCILSFRDEYPDIVPPEMRPQARELGRHCLLFDEFLVREAKAGRLPADAFRRDEVTVWLHGHCHQKSLIGTGESEAMLRLIPGVEVRVIPSGCCGMAGSFGYEKKHYATSMAIGEQVLFPAVREAAAGQKRRESEATGDCSGPLVAAPGISCRTQILDGTGVVAYHPIDILYMHLDH